METSALNGSLKYRIVDTTSNVFIVMNDWFVLFKSETRFIERFWGSYSMVFNNTSPHRHLFLIGLSDFLVFTHLTPGLVYFQL
jgi:hypothetical protein